MKAELTDISTVKKRIEIEIPADLVADEITSIARSIARKARVPGFRPGKAPLDVIKTRYRDDILSEMYQHLLPRYFADAVREKALKVVDSPDFEEIDYNKGTPLRFKAAFEVYPILDITNHSAIPVEEVPTEVTDEEVDRTLDRMLEERSEITPVADDRELREGDFAEISFEGTLEGGGAEGLTGEKALCEIGGPATIKEFTQHLTGARAGDERTFDVRYRDDHPEKKLAGQSATYTVRVESIKEKVRPELDDEFAASLGEFASVNELRTEVRKNLELHKKNHAEEQMRERLLDWLADNNDFEVPESLVEHQVQVRLQRLMRDLSRQGINPQQLDMDWGKVRNEQYSHAIRDVRGSLILDHLAEKESIEVGDADIDSEIEAMAAEMQQPVGSIRDALAGGDGLERIQSQVRNRKILEILKKSARMVPAGSLGNDGSEPGPLADSPK